MKRFISVLLLSFLLLSSCSSTSDIFRLSDQVSVGKVDGVIAAEQASLLWKNDTAGLDTLSIAKYWNGTSEAYRTMMPEDEWKARDKSVLGAAYDNAFEERMVLDHVYALDAEYHILEDLIVYLNEEHSSQELLETAFYLDSLGLLASDSGMAIRPYIEDALLSDVDRLHLSEEEYHRLEELNLFEARLKSADPEELPILIGKLYDVGILDELEDVVLETVFECRDSLILDVIYPYVLERGIDKLIEPIEAEIVDMAFYYVNDLEWLYEYSFPDQFPDWVYRTYPELNEMYRSSMEEIDLAMKILKLYTPIYEFDRYDPEAFIELYWLCGDYLESYHYYEDDVSGIRESIEPYCVWYSTDSFASLMAIPERYRKAEIIAYDLGNRINTDRNLNSLLTSQVFTMFEFEVFEPGTWYDESYDLIIKASAMPGVFKEYFSYIFAFDYKLGKLHLVSAQSSLEGPDADTYDIYKSFFLERSWIGKAGERFLSGLLLGLILGGY